MREIELLSPAANKEIAFQAILHGADAIYMGASSHGARKKASNSLDDIREVVDFAHIFRCKVYVTVNTLVYEDEISTVESMISDLYRIGVDALIVQDMGILRMDIPPIALHASTQCDTRTAEKACFFEQAGFSQIVLARELSIPEIKNICESVTVPVECFIHGALCVSYSGRCRASYLANGRSANRGECAQMCRMSYDLVNENGKTLLKNKYLLSLKDFNATSNVEALMEAGVSSFKIEGRLKEVGYVKNITAWYRQLIDKIIAANPTKYRRSSFGDSRIDFTPDPFKSFNRGFSQYFLNGSPGRKLASIDTPKSMGEIISSVDELNNGDGISYFNSLGEYEGVRVNSVKNGKIIGATPFHLPANCTLHRTYNREWQTMMERKTAERKLWVDINVSDNEITAEDERGIKASIFLDVTKSQAKRAMNLEAFFSKLGNTPYKLRKFTSSLNPSVFIPASQITDMRRRLIEALSVANQASYPFCYRRKENRSASFIAKTVDSRENISNSLSEKFYKDHNVDVGAKAFEVEDKIPSGAEVMHTRYCILRELGMCLKSKDTHTKNREIKRGEIGKNFYLVSGKDKFRAQVDCKNCGMRLYKA